jgi:hypothetical protein
MSIHARCLVLLLVVVVTNETVAGPFTFSVGNKEVIYTSSKRKSKGGSNWPDGNIGIAPLGNGKYDFYAANGTKPVRTTGTLTDPGTSKKSVKIANVPKKAFNYVAGGPVFQDPNNGTRFMIYHAEKHGKSAKDYYSVLGLAICLDPKGLTFTDLGTIIEPNIPINQTVHSIDIGGGSFAIFDDQLHIYYRDYLAGGGSAELAVARAPLSEVLSNSYSGQRTNFSKYYNGSWSEPGIGGRASALEIGNPANAWSAVSYNDYLDQVVMVSSQWEANKNDLYMSTSADGINWSPREAIDVDAGEQFYPSIIGTGADPNRSGQSFYVYYTDSQKGAWSRWNDAKLVRREITFEPSIQPPPPVDTPMDWVTMGDYRDDFQPGGPAEGWHYAWNSNGKLGASAVMTPLIWSDSTQAYNTTGGALTVPTNVIHNDDYLHLSATGGHPGHPRYMPVVGYTIQVEDGAGNYRLTESAIQKHDSITSTNEDGLGVLVYLNNTLLGSTTRIGTDGLVANFDRELGELQVGDTIWVMVDPLANLYFDSFMNLDFSIQKGIPIDDMGAGGLAAIAAVPEPGAVTLLLIAALIGGLGSRSFQKRSPEAHEKTRPQSA